MCQQYAYYASLEHLLDDDDTMEWSIDISPCIVGWVDSNLVKLVGVGWIVPDDLTLDVQLVAWWEQAHDIKLKLPSITSLFVPLNSKPTVFIYLEIKVTFPELQPHVTLLLDKTCILL